MDICKRIFPGFYWNVSKIHVNGIIITTYDKFSIDLDFFGEF